MSCSTEQGLQAGMEFQEQTLASEPTHPARYLPLVPTCVSTLHPGWTLTRELSPPGASAHLHVQVLRPALCSLQCPTLTPAEKADVIFKNHLKVK